MLELDGFEIRQGKTAGPIGEDWGLAPCDAERQGYIATKIVIQFHSWCRTILRAADDGGAQYYLYKFTTPDTPIMVDW